MKSANRTGARPGARRRPGEQARAGTVLLVLIAFVLGAAVSALWSRRGGAAPGTSAASPPAGGPVAGLSEGTQAVLRGLATPVEIRYYALLNPASVSEAERALAGRVDRLLAAYEREGRGRVVVRRFDALTATNATAASADGIQAFHLDKGDACFLGLAVVHEDRKESLPRLLPEWEPAVEFDLTRAIVRVTSPSRAPSAVADTSLAASTADEVRRAIPNLASVSVEEGRQILRQQALQDFAAAAKEMEARVQQAQERLQQALSVGGEAAVQAARDELRRIQAEQAERLKAIGRRLEAQLTALEQIKGVPPPPRAPDAVNRGPTR
jgi:hypothetical protein